ncbi:restriction endonuclease subunit S [Streptococcus suis]|uniref:restriction endonuclease subunit S n=1 Tax=Streptococcus suis TaxID=1307 RepID=UPI002FC9AC03
MTKEKSTVPRLRFPGFTDAWKQRKAMDIFKPVSDKGYTDLPILSASQEYGMVRRDEIGIDIKFDKEAIVNYKRVLPGQFVIHLRSFQGGFAWSEIEGLTSPAYTILDFREINSSKFWQYVLTSPNFIKKLETVTYGIRDGRSISYSDFSTLGFIVPTLPEQEAIGSFFSDLDQLITLHQRQLDDVKELKKALLQKMFPKGNGNDFPELRFPEFTDAWKQRKLGEVAEINPKSVLPDKFKYVDLESVVGTEMISHRTEYKNSAPSRAQRVASKGDIFYQTVRPYQKNNYLFNFDSNDFVFSTGYAQLRPSCNGYFMFTVMQTEKFVNKVLDNCTGTSYPAINANKLAEIPIFLPPTVTPLTVGALPEQEAIGFFFSDLDQLITLHQRQLNHLKLLKKALLQQMFI